MITGTEIKKKVFISLNENNGHPMMPSHAYDGDAGYDLFVSRPAIVSPGSVADVHTDISIRLPHGYYARIVGRSSTLRKRRLVVNEGIIDNGYTGELFVCVLNTTRHAIQIDPGERLAQLIVQPIVLLDFIARDDLGHTERGNNGFGSSGK